MPYYFQLFHFTPVQLPRIQFTLKPISLPPSTFTEPLPSEDIPAQVNTETSSSENNYNYFKTSKKLPSEETLVNSSDHGSSSDEDISTKANEMASTAHTSTTGKDDGLIDSDIPSYEKIVSSEHVALVSENDDDRHIEEVSVPLNETVSPYTDMLTTNDKQVACLSNGFVADVPQSIVKRKSHIMTPYGDLLRVVLSNSLTYVTDLEDIMRGETALRFPLAPFDSRPAYMRYVRCGELMLKVLETRTSARCLPPITKRAWKNALEIASATRESPDFRISFHPQELGLDYDEYDGEHPRDFLARSLMILADHPKTRGILRRIAQEFAACQYDSTRRQNVPPESSHSSNADVRDVLDTGFALTKGKHPRPYEVQKQKLVVNDLRRIIQKFARKLEECANGVGCVQLGSSAMSKTVDHSAFTDTTPMDNLWNVTMEVTALQTNAGPVNYTTSYFSTTPSAIKNSPSWDSNLTEDDIFGPNVSVDTSPRVGWGSTPNVKERKYHLVNLEEVPEAEHLLSEDTSPNVLSKQQTGAIHGLANETKKMETATNGDSYCDGQSVCEGMASEQEIIICGPDEIKEHQKVKHADDSTSYSIDAKPDDSGSFNGQKVCQELALEQQNVAGSPVKVIEHPTAEQTEDPTACSVDAERDDSEGQSVCKEMAPEQEKNADPVEVIERSKANDSTACSVYAKQDDSESCDGQSVCQEKVPEQQEGTRTPVEVIEHPTAEDAEDSISSSADAESDDSGSVNGKVPAISKANRLRGYFKGMFEKQPTLEENKNPKPAITHSIPKHTQALDTVLESDEAESEISQRRVLFKQMKQACTIPFTNSHRDIFRFLQGKSTSKSLPIKEVAVPATKSPEFLADDVSRNHIRLPPFNGSSALGALAAEAQLNTRRPRKRSVKKAVKNSESCLDVPPKTKEPPDIPSQESNARFSASHNASHSVTQHRRNAKTIVGNWRVGKVAPCSKKQEEQLSKSSSPKNARHSPLERPHVHPLPPKPDVSCGSPNPRTPKPDVGWGSPNPQPLEAVVGWGSPNPQPPEAVVGWGSPNPRPLEAVVGWGSPIPLPPKPDVSWGSPKSDVPRGSPKSYVTRGSPRPDSCGSRSSAASPPPAKAKHEYNPNPLVISQWQKVVEQVTGTPFSPL